MSATRWVTRAALVAVAVLLVFFLFWHGTQQRRAVLELPAAERRAIYDKTLAAFRELCTQDGRGAFESRCGDDAALLSQFPECDESCRTAIAPYLPAPRR